jgi:hypothetical protein
MFKRIYSGSVRCTDVFPFPVLSLLVLRFGEPCGADVAASTVVHDRSIDSLALAECVYRVKQARIGGARRGSGVEFDVQTLGEWK